MKIHVIGNSHVNNFSNANVLTKEFDNGLFKSYWLGPIIAYNFKEHYFDKVKEILKNIPAEDYVSFILGEVDCRLHIPLKADEQKRSDEEVVKECLNRFFGAYLEVSKNHKIIIFGTHPTTIAPHDMKNSQQPIYGSCERRNNICRIWNSHLKELADKNNFVFISIYDKLVDKNNVTKMEYFLDYCHLNSSKVYYYILDELRQKKIITF